MERVGTLPRGVIDLDPFNALFARKGPVLSLVLGTPAATEQAAQKDRLRWRDERRRLEEEGLPAAVADQVDGVVAEAHHRGEALAVYADPQGVFHEAHAPVPPRTETARWDTVASIGPVVEWLQREPAFVVAAVDHLGADLFAGGAARPDVIREVGPAERYPIEKNQPGGWSQRHYQQHAVENWSKNAREVADQMGSLVAQVQPEVVIVGGDPRSVSLLRQALPKEIEDRVQEGPVSRAVDGNDEAAGRAVARAVATVAARQSVEVIEEFRQHLGRGDRAVEGAEETFAALGQGRVAVLLFSDEPDDTRRAWFGSEPGLGAVTRSALEGVGSGPAGEGRMIDVALRCAAATSAAARAVPKAAGPRDGLGALLRWPT